MANFYLSTFRKFSLSILLFTGLCLFGLNGLSQTQFQNFTTTGAQTWTAPCGVTSVTVEVWAGGGSGGAAYIDDIKQGGGGGAGGAFARKLNIAVTPGNTYNLFVGAGGLGEKFSSNSGGNSWFLNSSTILAKGGARGISSNGVGGIGTSNGSIGDIVFRGGSGYDGNNNLGAAGGGGAGNGAIGGDATEDDFGVGGYAGGGDGGAPRTNNGAGNNASYFGGGGAGARKGTGTANNAGGNGGNGLVKITYTAPPPNYCAINFTSIVEPITLVNFVGTTPATSINRSTTNNTGGPALQLFCDEATVLKGSSYAITVKGNTNDDYDPYFYTNYFTVFFDWNQDGDYDDSGEKFNIGTIYSSTGLDSKSATTNILIPAGAALGKTKMRVVKNYDGYVTSACGNNSYGQAEEYIVNVTQICQSPTQALANGSSGTVVVCSGTQVNLSQTGGSAGGGRWVWKKGTCGAGAEFYSNNTDAGYSFTAGGPGSTTFFVQAECGGTCASVTVEVRAAGGISLTSAVATQNQEVCNNTTITPVVYTATGSPVTVSLTGNLPVGVNGSYVGGATKKFTISGTPNATQTGIFEYTLTVSGNSPCANTPEIINGSITVYAEPTLSYSSNNATYCTGGPITTNVPTVSGGPTATSYSINPTTLPAGLNFNTTTGEITGTPSAIQAATNYTITATTNCTNASTNISITISSGNNAYAITPNGTQNVCSDFGGKVIGLVNSDNGISYQLYLDNNPVPGAIISPSSGGPINFGLQSAPGTYTVRTILGCSTNMLGSTIIIITPAPTTTFSYPSNIYCKSGISDPAIISGSPQTGTFSAFPTGLIFTNNVTGEIDLNNSAVNDYVVTYTIPAAGGCAEYTTTTNLQILASPAYYNVTGGGGYCTGGIGVQVGLNGSQSGVTYQLLLNNNPIGTPVNGSGSPILFGNQTVAGTYTVEASISGGCTQQMDYEAIVTVNSAPANIAVTPVSATICQGTVQPLTATLSPTNSTNGFQEVSSGTISQTITDNNTTGTSYLFKMTGIPVGATITAVRLEYYLTHDRDQDLIINLKGSNGNVLNIASGINGVNYGTSAANPTRIDNISNTSITTGTSPYTGGPYAPQGVGAAIGGTAVLNNVSNTTVFSGLYNSSSQSANGNWFFSVRDNNSSGGNGLLRYCKLRIEYTTVNNPTLVTWSPVTDLFTDPGATLPYSAGSSATSVYVKPSTSGTLVYTATNTNTFGCTSTATTTLTVNPSPTITVTADYCNVGGTAGTVRINATSTVNISNWLWNTGSTAGVPLSSFIEVNTAGNYYVSAKANGTVCAGTGVMSIAQELVTNGDFELGNQGFESDYNYYDDVTGNSELVPDQGADGYGVGEDGQFYHNNFWGLDHTLGTGTGKYMLVNGHDSVLVVWKNEAVTVIPNTEYYFSAWGRSLNAAGPFAALRFKVNGVKVGTTGVLDPGTNSNSNSNWKRFYGTWNSGPATSADIFIVDTVAAAGGNDFGLDDISFGTLSTFFTLNSAFGDTVQADKCAGSPIDDIFFEVGGDGNPPVISSGSLPAGLTTYWNGRTFRISGSPTNSGTFNFSYTTTGCNPKTQNIKLTVKPASNPGTFTSSIISACYDGSGDLSTSLTGTVGSLTWYSSPSGNPGTFSLASGTYTNLTSAAYYVAVAENTAACALKNSDTVLVGIKNLWTGNVGNNWGDALNWSDNQLPSISCDDVVIPLVSPKFRAILSTGNPQIKNLRILTGGTLEINNDATLKVAGTITAPIAAITANEGNIELNAVSNGNQSISGSWFKNKNLKRLIVSSNVTNSAVDTLNILFGLSFGNNAADLNTGNNITLRSTPTATASVGKIVSGNTITGQFNVERYIKYYQNWNMLSAPITNGQSVYSSWQENGAVKTSNGRGTQITAPTLGSGIDNTSIGNSLKYYDAANGSYSLINNTNSASVNIKEGYYIYVRGDRGYGPGSAGSVTTLRSKGAIYDAATTPSKDYTVPTNSFIAIGNPYASAVDLPALAATNSTKIEENFYFWDPTLYGSYGVGGYQNVSLVTDYYPTPSSSLYKNNKKYTEMQSGQAIFARTVIADPTISFNENLKADSSLQFARGGDQVTPIVMLSTMIYSSNDDLADGNRVVFASNYSNNVDRFDAIKITNGGINFGLLRNSKKLIVEARQPVVSTDTLFYNMSNLRNGIHTLGFSVQNFNSNLEATLIDNYLQSRTPISLSDSSWYKFNADANAASKAANRFMLVFKAAAGPLPVTLTGISASRNTDRSIAIRWTVENEVNIEKYEVERSADGRNFTGIISADATNSNVYTKNDLSPLVADNFYRIKAITVGGYTQYSAIVKVAPLQELASITVYPNPVIDGRTQVRFINQTAGTYELKLFNQAGQLMQQENVKVSGNSFIKTFVLNNNFAGGVYQLTILNPDGTSTVQNLIIK